MRWTFWLHCRPKDLVFHSWSSHDHSSFTQTKLTYMHPMSCQHLKCAFLPTLVRTPPVPNDHEVFPCSYSVHICRLFRSLPTGKNLPSSLLWGLSLTCYCALYYACVQVLQEFAQPRLFQSFSSILCANFAVRAWSTQTRSRSHFTGAAIGRRTISITGGRLAPGDSIRCSRVRVRRLVVPKNIQPARTK